MSFYQYYHFQYYSNVCSCYKFKRCWRGNRKKKSYWFAKEEIRENTPPTHVDKMGYSQHWWIVNHSLEFSVLVSHWMLPSQKTSVWLWCLPSLCCQCWGGIMKIPLSRVPPLSSVTCHVCSVSHDAWVQMSYWPQPSLWILRDNCGWTAEHLLPLLLEMP